MPASIRPNSLPLRAIPFALALLLTASASAAAKSAANALAAAPRPALFDGLAPEPATATFADRRVEIETEISRAVYAPSFTAAAAEPEAMAREYLEARRAELGLEDRTLADLVHRGTRRGLAATTVRFDQRVGGVLVDGGDVAVSFDASGRVLFVMNGYRPNLAGLATTPSISAAAAHAAAFSRLGIAGAPLAFDETTLVFAPDGASARLAWRVNVVPGVEPHGDWEVLVDARTGEVVRVANRACHADGTGNVFDADPLSSAHATYGQTGFTDANDAASAQLNGQLRSVTLPDITLDAGTYTLVGPYAAITDFESPFRGLFGQASSAFAFNRLQDGFEAANCYYHIDHVMRHINETLGIPLMPNEYSGGVRFDPHGLSGADNSHYLPSTGSVSFGEGGVDDAEDSDVVIHELGHGIHDWAANGLSQVNGLSEGVGDYFAQSYSRSLGQWASNEPPFHWTFNWDGHNPFWPGRITNYSATYPGGLVGQVHTDGQIWATCLMRIWNQVGRDKTDAAHIEGLAMTNGSSNQNDAANAVAQAAAALGYAPAEVAAFLNEFAATGYTVAAGLAMVGHSTVSDGCGQAWIPGDLRGEEIGNGIWEPGETVFLTATLESSLLTRTNVAGTLTTSTPGITITDGAATWPTLLPSVPTETDLPYFSIEIDSTVACYSTIALQLTVTCAESGPHVYAITRTVGESLTPPGLPVVIPNNNPAGVASTLDIGQDVTLTDLNAHVVINHTWVGDLKIQLQSPAGTTVTLLDRPGFPPGNGCNNVNMDVTFDSASAFNLENHCAGTNPWYVGVGAPAQSLDAFNGQSTSGTWKLLVTDPVAGGTGSIVDWELLTTPALVTSCEVCEPIDPTGASIAAGGAEFSLEPSRPNPFSGATEIRFALGSAGPASLRVYDVSGRHVATLADGVLAAGAHTATWNGTDASGRSVAGGIYFYRLTSGEGTKIERMQLLR